MDNNSSTNKTPSNHNSSPMQLKDLMILVLLASIWGASFMFTRVSSPEFGAFAFASLRLGLAAVVLFPILMMAGNWKHLRDNFWMLVFISIFNSAMPFVMFAYATLYLEAGMTSVLNSFVPMLSGLIAHIYFKDYLSRSQQAGLVIGIIGVGILMMDKMGIGNNTILPLCACLTACLSYAVSANITKRKLSHVPPKVLAASTMLVAGLLLIPFGVLTWPEEMPGLTAWSAVIAVAVLSTAFAYLLFFELIKNIGPTRTVSVTLLIPIFGIFWGALLLDEPITISIIVGTIVIITGAYLSLSLKLPSRRRQASG